MFNNKTTFEQVGELYTAAHSVISKTLTLEMTIHEKRLEKWQHRDVPGVFDRQVFPQQQMSTMQTPQGMQRTLYQPSQQTAMINDIKSRATELMAMIVALESSLNAQEQWQATFPYPPSMQAKVDGCGESKVQQTL